jgi:hypothetical protein
LNIYFSNSFISGLDQYLPVCRKAFDGILRTLDIQVFALFSIYILYYCIFLFFLIQVGRSLMLTAAHVRGKELDDLVGADVRPKLELLRTCIAAIPRLLPDPMPHSDLIEFLTRMSVHIDEELRGIVGTTLQNIVTECPEWREDTVCIDQ